MEDINDIAQRLLPSVIKRLAESEHKMTIIVNGFYATYPAFKEHKDIVADIVAKVDDATRDKLCPITGEHYTLLDILEDAVPLIEKKIAEVTNERI